MSITRLSGGLTPADGNDPRTFPAIWNATADSVESTQETVASQGSAISVLESDVEDLQDGLIGGTAVYRYVDTVYFTSNGTFSKGDYPWLRAIRVKCQGGGGAGGGATDTTSGQAKIGSGGNGGVYAESFITNISGLAASVTVTRGAGGVGTTGAPGPTGGASSFGSLVSANGGTGGFNTTATTFPTGQTSPDASDTGTGDLVVGGSPGHPGVAYRDGAGQSFGGTGGDSVLGRGGNAGVQAARNQNAGGFGGGGGGTGLSPNTAGRNGGNGSNGLVIVELYA